MFRTTFQPRTAGTAAPDSLTPNRKAVCMKFISSIRFSVLVCAVLALSVSASAQTQHYVSLDGECDGNTPCYSTIQAAVDAAVNGDEVIVGPGSYVQSAVIANISNKTITLRSSGGADVTFLTNTNQWANAIHLVNVGSGTVIEGFTFLDCVIGRSGWTAYAVVGISGNGTPTIRDCVFENTTAVANDTAIIYKNANGGMTIKNCTFLNNNNATVISTWSGSTANVTIEGCSFINNHTVGTDPASVIYLTGEGNTSILNCDFDSNTAALGTIHTRSDAGSITIDSCTFTDNTVSSGGGVFVDDPPFATGTVTIIDSTFDGNSASGFGGGAFLLGTNTSVIGCTFTNNTATSYYGGGIHVASGATPTISNCLFTMNHAGGSGGGLYSHADAFPTIVDTVFCQNTSQNVVIAGLATFSGLNFITDNPDCASVAEFGACCMPDGGCVVTTLASCLAASGTFQGAETTCDEAECPEPEPMGACCMLHGDCVSLTETTCLAASGTYHGDDTSCRDVQCIQPCLGDLNLDGVVDGADLLILLSAWGQCP
jgi:parallel beta-helix repeat protein